MNKAKKTTKTAQTPTPRKRKSKAEEIVNPEQQTETNLPSAPEVIETPTERNPLNLAPSEYRAGMKLCLAIPLPVGGYRKYPVDAPNGVTRADIVEWMDRWIAYGESLNQWITRAALSQLASGFTMNQWRKFTPAEYKSWNENVRDILKGRNDPTDSEALLNQEIAKYTPVSKRTLADAAQGGVSYAKSKLVESKEVETNGDKIVVEIRQGDKGRPSYNVFVCGDKVSATALIRWFGSQRDGESYRWNLKQIGKVLQRIGLDGMAFSAVQAHYYCGRSGNGRIGEVPELTEAQGAVLCSLFND
jgi:hypothetical protein